MTPSPTTGAKTVDTEVVARMEALVRRMAYAKLEGHASGDYLSMLDEGRAIAALLPQAGRSGRAGVPGDCRCGLRPLR